LRQRRKRNKAVSRSKKNCDTVSPSDRQSDRHLNKKKLRIF
jgi:hypothetical protein